MLAEYGTRCCYNSFDNEWDLCSEFSGDGSNSDDDSIYAEDYEYLVEATLEENTNDEYIDSNPLNRSPSPLDEPSHDIGASQNDLQETSIILADHYRFIPPLADLPTTPDSCQKVETLQEVPWPQGAGRQHGVVTRAGYDLFSRPVLCMAWTSSCFYV